MVFYLKDKDDALIKEHARAMDAAALLNYSKVQCRIATDRALASEERTRVAEEHAKAESDRAKVVENRVGAVEAQANAMQSWTM